MPTQDITYYYLDALDQGPESDRREDELLRVALALNRGSSAAELTDILFDSLNHLVPYERIGLAVVRPGGKLTLVHVRSRRPVLWGRGATAPLAGSSLAPIVAERKIRVINDLAAYERDHPASKTAARMVAEGMRSSLTLPVSAGASPIGVVFFSSVKPHAYGPEHVDFLRALAAGFGLALERAELTASLRRANEELQTLDALKTNFLSNLSHELRTPLSRLLGNAYALREGDAGALNAAQAQQADEIVAGAEQLGALLQDLFDYTAFEAGRLRPERVPVDLGAIAAEVADEHRPAMADAGLDFEVMIAPEPAVVAGQAPMLARAIGALLDNARKFTPAPGTVTLTVSREGSEARVVVADTGLGVPLEAQPHLFEKFYQVDSGPSRAHGGTGLGLALVRAIVLAHGGSVWVESRPGEGARFRMSFPLVEP